MACRYVTGNLHLSSHISHILCLHCTAFRYAIAAQKNLSAKIQLRKNAPTQIDSRHSAKPS